VESGFNVPDGEVRLGEMSDYMYLPVYHPLACKMWMDCGAAQRELNLDDLSEEECEAMNWPDPQHEFDERMKSDDVAFIGNSIAFHMGGADADHEIAMDGFVTHATTIVFE
jgi:hypothetical protein